MHYHIIIINDTLYVCVNNYTNRFNVFVAHGHSCSYNRDQKQDPGAPCDSLVLVLIGVPIRWFWCAPWHSPLLPCHIYITISL